jgi:hypothetical protein
VLDTVTGKWLGGSLLSAVLSVLALCASTRSGAIELTRAATGLVSSEKATSCGVDSLRVVYYGTTDVSLVHRICQYALAVAKQCQQGHCDVHGVDTIRADASLVSLLQRHQIGYIRLQHESKKSVTAYVSFGSVHDTELMLVLTYNDGEWHVTEWGVALE